MVRAPLAHRLGVAPAAGLVTLGLVLLTPAIAGASLSEPWAHTELDGALAIESGHGRYIAVGSAGAPAQAAAWSSLDGHTWELATVVDPPVGSAMTDVVATEDGFVAFGVESMVDDRIGERVHAWSSADGLEWQDAVVGAPSRKGFQVIAQGLATAPSGQLALAMFRGKGGGSGVGAQRLWRTTDGQTWERVALPKTDGQTWGNVVSVPQGFLLLGQSITGEAYNWRSTDGTTWQQLTDTPQLYDVTVSDAGVLLGMGYQDLWRSPKSLRGWRKVMTRPKGWKTEGANAFSAIAWDGSEFVVVGRDVSSCDPGDDCELNPVLVSLEGSTWSEADSLLSTSLVAWRVTLGLFISRSTALRASR